MQLVLDFDVQGSVPEDFIVLTRHGIDVPHLTHELNQPLTEETKPDIKSFGAEIVRFAQQLQSESITLHHSTRLRGIQTAAILAEEFFKAHVPVQIHEAAGIREIYQGHFLIKNYAGQGDYAVLVEAWKAWQEQLDKNELLYRFGDPSQKADGSITYPKLNGWFTKLGENQAEFSLRLYSFLKTILSDSDNHLTVVVAHQASCSRIQRIFSAIHQLKSADEFAPGDFVKLFEKQGARRTIEPACGIAIKKPPCELSLHVLDKELAFLKNIT